MRTELQILFRNTTSYRSELEIQKHLQKIREVKG